MNLLKLIALMAAGLAMACQAPSNGPAVVPQPRLFPAGGLYELFNPKGEPTGYVFAENGPGPSRQTVRWLLFANFKSPSYEEVFIRRAAQGPGGLPQSSAELADAAREMMATGAHATYVKSYADTFSVQHDSVYKPGMTVTTPTIPVPNGRRPPDPPGSERPAEWLASDQGAWQQIDPGGVGIRPGDPPVLTDPITTPIPTPAGGGGYLPPVLQMPLGILGMAFASPIGASNTEYLFLSSLLFPNGLDRVSLSPFRDLALPMDGPPLGDFAVIVVSSSYYPGYVPNQW